MSEQLATMIALLVAAAFLAGLYGERFRAKLGRKKWRRSTGDTGALVRPFAREARGPVGDSADQLRSVMAASFEARRILSKAEAQVLVAAEKAIRDNSLSWRVMAQVSLGEILHSPDARAYSAINSKRVDLLLVSRGGHPIAAIEYQGAGHYQGTAPARDAVKKEALRKAGVRYIEVTPEHGSDHLAREISRISALEASGGASRP